MLRSALRQDFFFKGGPSVEFQFRFPTLPDTLVFGLVLPRRAKFRKPRRFIWRHKFGILVVQRIGLSPCAGTRRAISLRNKFCSAIQGQIPTESDARRCQPRPISCRKQPECNLQRPFWKVGINLIVLHGHYCSDRHVCYNCARSISLGKKTDCACRRPS